LCLQPLLNAVTFDVIQIGRHGPMVRPFIVHEFMNLTTGIIATIAAEIDAPFSGALSELTLSCPIVDSVTQATITIACPTGTAEETTGTI